MLFLNNKYTKTYYDIIGKYQSSSGEHHHIIPRALGGSNDPTNLVLVSPKTHFILHRLLCKMVISQPHKLAMNYALFMMMNRKISNYSSRTYENSRNLVSETMKSNNPMHNKTVLNKRIGQKRTQNTKDKISQANYRRWENTARPIREFDCSICGTHIRTRKPEKKYCSKSCHNISKKK